MRRGHTARLAVLVGVMVGAVGGLSAGPVEGPALAGVEGPGAEWVSGRAAPVSERAAPLGRASRGGSLVIDRDELVAYAADADNSALHRVDLVSGAVVTTPLECAPEQVVLLGSERLAVSLRGCSKVALLEIDAAGDAKVIAERDVPSDPWGLAATPRGEVLVTSAWGHSVTALDAGSLAIRWSIPVRREPRSITVMPDGSRAFVTHIVGEAVSILDLNEGALRGGPPPVRLLNDFNRLYRNRVDRAIGATPLRTTGALAYASALSDSSARLFVPYLLEQNGASGGVASSSGGYGGVSVEQDTSTSSVAVIATRGALAMPGAAETESPLRYGERVVGVAPPPPRPPPNSPPPTELAMLGSLGGKADPIDRKVLLSADTFSSLVSAPAAAPSRQARAAAVMGGSLFVTSLGTNELCELDARAIDPSMSVVRTFVVGEGPTGVDVDPRTGIAVTWNQFSHDVSIVSLGSGEVETIPVASDPLDRVVAAGRRLFFTERDRHIARDGRACAACHPDGRDDGVVWSLEDGPRQTPTLVGRVNRGPFGWLGKHARLEDNMRETMTRLGGSVLPAARVNELAAYLRSIPPPHRGAPAPLSPEASRGHDLFVSAEVGCSSCHALDREASDRETHNVSSEAPGDKSGSFRTPPLLFVAETAPYFHDGRYATLEQLLADNNDRMGSTTHLSDADLADLAAFLRTL